MSDTNTTTTETVKPLTVKELAAKRKAIREEAKSITSALTKRREDAKAEEQEAAKNLLKEIGELGQSTVVVGEGDKAMTLTLEEALVTGKVTTITVNTAEGPKERAHTAFMDAARVESLRKLLVRAKKILANEEIRPKANPKDNEASA